MPALFVLYETAAGYSLFEVIGLDELGQSSDAVQQSTLDLTRFGKVVKLQAFAPFKNAAHALDEMNAISEAVLTDDLQNFLEANLPKVQICVYTAILAPLLLQLLIGMLCACDILLACVLFVS